MGLGVLLSGDIGDSLKNAKDELDAERYRWLRVHLEYIDFEGGSVLENGQCKHSSPLTVDTCDIGLDHAIDKRIGQQRDRT